MCHIENCIFQSNSSIKPRTYVRYANDIYLNSDSEASVKLLKDTFEANSVLTFSYEIENNKSLPLLDVLVTDNNNNYQTSVYVKEINFGDCVNYNGVCPERYKISVIGTLLHRAYHI